MISDPPVIDDYPTLRADITRAVHTALKEDIGDGDITARLIPADQTARATLITREDCVVCGIPWVNEVFRQLDPAIQIDWQVKDGDFARANDTLCTLAGNTRHLLTGERTALNFLQLLSGTATSARQYTERLKDSPVKILDTRKTIPGLRTAQKYAVRCGGCFNHRTGLYDAFLIKENHIAACGGIARAVERAREMEPDKRVEVEVESLAELEEAIAAKVDVVMLDNFGPEDTATAIQYANSHCKIEISGNITADSMAGYKSNYPDYISSGALTKHCTAVDMSFRISQ